MSAQRTSVTSNQRVAAVPWIVSTVLQPTNASWTAMSSFWAEEPAEDEEERCRRLRVDRRGKVRLVGDGDVHFATGVVVLENSLLVWN